MGQVHCFHHWFMLFINYLVFRGYLFYSFVSYRYFIVNKSSLRIGTSLYSKLGKIAIKDRTKEIETDKIRENDKSFEGEIIEFDAFSQEQEDHVHLKDAFENHDKKNQPVEADNQTKF